MRCVQDVWRWLAVVWTVVGMWGCATPPLSPSTAPGTQASPAATPPQAPADVPVPRPGQPPPTVLAGEVRWMQALFDGTPVRIVAESDGAMRVDVPLAFSFDASATAPKPPLRAVMDKLTATMSRQPSAKLQLAAPGPPARAAAMRSYVGGKGVLALRVATLPPPPGDLVTLRVVPGPVAIDKLDDQALPPPTGAFPTVKSQKPTSP